MVVMIQLDATFAALADPTRRAILARLTEGPASIAELTKPFDVSQQAISKHVAVLDRAGLVRKRREGRISRCELDAAPLESAADWIAHYKSFWAAKLDRLETYLNTQAENQDGEAS